MKLGERNRNMRSFEYYLYGDCPANASADNPRALFGAKADAVLSMILEFESGDCRYDALCKQFSEEYIQSLIRIGLIRTENGAVLLDSTVLTGKDVFKLESGMRARAVRMQIDNCAAYCQHKIDSQHDDARLDHIQLTPFVEMIGHEIHLRFHYGARAQESQSQI